MHARPAHRLLGGGFRSEQVEAHDQIVIGLAISQRPPVTAFVYKDGVDDVSDRSAQVGHLWELSGHGPGFGGPQERPCVLCGLPPTPAMTPAWGRLRGP